MSASQELITILFTERDKLKTPVMLKSSEKQILPLITQQRCNS